MLAAHVRSDFLCFVAVKNLALFDDINADAIFCPCEQMRPASVKKLLADQIRRRSSSYAHMHLSNQRKVDLVTGVGVYILHMNRATTLQVPEKYIYLVDG